MNFQKALLVTGIMMLGFTAGPAMAAGSASCSGGTIKVGAVSTVTGVADFSECRKRRRRPLDQLNAAGGINGCKIDYTISDDKADAQVAAQAARDLIDNKEVVAMVGSASSARMPGQWSDLQAQECDVGAGGWASMRPASTRQHRAGQCRTVHAVHRGELLRYALA